MSSNSTAPEPASDGELWSPGEVSTKSVNDEQATVLTKIFNPSPTGLERLKAVVKNPDHEKDLAYLESQKDSSDSFNKLYQAIVGDDPSWVQDIERSETGYTGADFVSAVAANDRASAYDVQSRLDATLNTDKGPFSQVVAISQGAVNANLQFLWALNPDVQTVDIEGRVGMLNAKLSPPQVMFQVSGKNLSMVSYYCNFQSGTVQVWDDDKNDWTSPVDLTGWKLVFDINMNKLDVLPGTDEYDELATVIHNPGDYSIKRLYLDFNTADIRHYREDLSDFKGFAWPNSVQQTYFGTIMSLWGTNMQGSKQNTVGYSLTTSNPSKVNPQAPTFPPTSMSFQVYPYLKQGQTTPYEGVDGDGNKNMILYLEMTQNLPFPQQNFLTYSGNWVIPDAGMDGTMCISDDIFWNSYLLRPSAPVLLMRLTQVTHFTAVDAYTEYYGFSADFSYKYAIGPQSGVDYSWVAQPDGLSWTWDSDNQKYSQSGDYAFGSEITLKGSTHNRMTIQPGSNVIKVSGKSSFSVKQNSYSFGIAEGGEAWVNLDWAMNITLDSVVDGGLSINLNLPPNDSDVFKITSGQDSWFGHGSDASDMQASIVSLVNRNQLADAQNDLQSALTSTAKFFLPGAGTFFFKNPIFNSHGDMILEVRYDGVDDFLGRKIQTDDQAPAQAAAE